MLQGMMGELIRKAQAGGITLRELLREMRRQYIVFTLEETQGNEFKAAKRLQMHRNTLSRHVDDLQINVRDIRSAYKSYRKKPAGSVAPEKGQRWHQG